MSGREDERPPVISIHGNPTPEEVAAVVAALASLGSGSPGPSTRPNPTSGNGWAARWRALGAQPRPGPDAWRQTSRPR